MSSIAMDQNPRLPCLETQYTVCVCQKSTMVIHFLLHQLQKAGKGLMLKLDVQVCIQK